MKIQTRNKTLAIVRTQRMLKYKFTDRELVKRRVMDRFRVKYTIMDGKSVKHGPGEDKTQNKTHTQKKQTKRTDGRLNTR